jgi:hypothetical protein
MMKKITVLLCGAAMAAMLGGPVFAGGKTIAGSATTAPSAILVAAQKYLNAIGLGSRHGKIVQVEDIVQGGQQAFKITLDSGATVTTHSKTIAFLLANYS